MAMEHVVVSGSSITGDPLQFVVSGEARIAVLLPAAVAEGTSVSWYVDRTGLVDAAQVSRYPRDYYVKRADESLRGLLTLAAEGGSTDATVRANWLGSKPALVGDLHQRPARSIVSLSLFAEASRSMVTIRRRPGWLSGLELDVEDFERVGPMVFNPAAHIYLGAREVDPMLPMGIAAALGLPVFVWRGVAAAGREGDEPRLIGQAAVGGPTTRRFDPR